MSKARTWTLGLILAMVVVILAGWQLGISPIVSQISLANSQAATIETSNASTQSQLAALKVQYASIDTLQSNLDALRLSIPEQAAASSFINEVTSLASKTGVTVQSITLADATVYGASTGSTTPAGMATTSTATATPATTPAVGSPGTSVAGAGLIAIQVTIAATGTHAAVQDFIGLVQTGTRLFVSNSASLDGGAAAASTELSGDIFTLQGTSDQTSTGGSSSDSTSTPTPYPTLTPTPTATPTPTSTPTTAPKSGTTTHSTPTPTPTS